MDAPQTQSAFGSPASGSARSVGDRESGLAGVFPIPTPLLTWTCAGPVFEYALRSAICGGLQLGAWPRMGAEWAFLAPEPEHAGEGAGGGAGGGAGLLRGGLTVPDFDTGRLAAAAANGSRWMVRRRARRILGTVDEWVEGDTEVVAALARGRRDVSPGSRLADDLLLTSARLRDVAFRVWSHHAHVSSAEWALSGDTSSEALARHLTGCGALPLWGRDDSPGEDGSDAAKAVRGEVRARSAPFAEALRRAFGELRLLVDELAARAMAAGILPDPGAIESTDWNALPELVGALPDVPV
ncbi:MAG: hypothetical protein DYH08_01980 [Actinobacteria bacterium ATB1]|nr:hypothetical protein [Actinobacteria bacterium ATB1]